MLEVTIKELADEIGVSKTAINKKVTEEMKEKYYYKVGNRFLINPEGQTAIKAMFIDYLNDDEKEKVLSKTSDTEEDEDSEKSENKSKNTETESENTDTNSITTQTNPLANNLSETAMKIMQNYQDQLVEKDRQMAELHKIIDQQQQLTLQTNQQNERLRIQINAYEDDDIVEDGTEEDIVAEEIKEKKAWWKIWK